MPIEASDACIWRNGFSQQIKHTREHKDKHTQYIQSPADAMGANVNPLFQSAGPDIIHSPSVCLSFLCHSDALRCVRSYIHHLSRASILYLTHTLKQATLLSPLLSKKIEGFGG